MLKSLCLNVVDVMKTYRLNSNAIIKKIWPEYMVTLSRQCYHVPSSAISMCLTMCCCPLQGISWCPVVAGCMSPGCPPSPAWTSSKVTFLHSWHVKSGFKRTGFLSPSLPEILPNQGEGVLGRGVQRISLHLTNDAIAKLYVI